MILEGGNGLLGGVGAMEIRRYELEGDVASCKVIFECSGALIV